MQTKVKVSLYHTTMSLYNSIPLNFGVVKKGNIIDPFSIVIHQPWKFGGGTKDFFSE